MEREHVFLTLLQCSMALLLLKEAVKFFIILRCLVTAGEGVPPRLKHVCSSSVFWPLLALAGRQHVDDIISHEGTGKDYLWELAYDGLCENLPQLLLAFHFTVSLLYMGLNDLQLMWMNRNAITASIQRLSVRTSVHPSNVRNVSL